MSNARSEALTRKLKEHCISSSASPDFFTSEHLNYRLPIVIKPETTIAGLTIDDLKEKFAMYKHWSNYYLQRFNETPKSRNTEREWFQKCCEWHTAKMMVCHMELETLAGIQKIF